MKNKNEYQIKLCEILNQSYLRNFIITYNYEKELQVLVFISFCNCIQCETKDIHKIVLY